MKLEQPGIFVDRYQEMSVQQKLIEQKKKQVEQKLMEKKRCEVGISGNPAQSEYIKRPGFTGKSSLPELMPPRVLASAELFANDGSFMEKFLRLQQEMKDGNLEDAPQGSETAEQIGSQTVEMAKAKSAVVTAELKLSTPQSTSGMPENAATGGTPSVEETTAKQQTLEGNCVLSAQPQGLDPLVPNPSLVLASPAFGQHGSTFVAGRSHAEPPVVTNHYGSDHVPPSGSFPPPLPPSAPGTSFPAGFLPSFRYLAAPLPPPMSGPAGYPRYPMGYGPSTARPGVPYYPGPVSGRGVFPPPPAPPPPPPPSSSNQSIMTSYGSPGFGRGGFPPQWPPFRPHFGGPWQVGPREPPMSNVSQPPSAQDSGAPFVNPGESLVGSRGPSVNVVGPPVGPGGQPTGHSNPQLQPAVPPLIPTMKPSNVQGPNNMVGQFSGDFSPQFPPTSQFGPRPPFQGGPVCEPFDSKPHNSRPELGYENSEDFVDDDDFGGVQEDDDDYGLRHKQNKRQVFREDFRQTSNSNLEFCDYGRSRDGVGNLHSENNDHYGYSGRVDSLFSHSFIASGRKSPRSQSPSHRQDLRQSSRSPDREERQRSRSPYRDRGDSFSYGGLREPPYDDWKAGQGSSSDHHSWPLSDEHWYRQSNAQRLPNDADFRNGKREGNDPELCVPVRGRYV